MLNLLYNQQKQTVGKNFALKSHTKQLQSNLNDNVITNSKDKATILLQHYENVSNDNDYTPEFKQYKLTT